MEKIVPVIIPAYEPDNRLLDLLGQLAKNDISPILIVDDGSGDEYRYCFDTSEDEYHATVIHHDVNCGKGRALKTAFSYCLENFSPLLGCITADSDGQHTPASILACKRALLEEKDNLILGVRDFDGADIPRKSSFGNNMTRKVFRHLYKKDISDTQTGLRGIPANYMEALLELQGERFEFETRMLIDAIERQIGIKEVSGAGSSYAVLA